MSSLQMPSKSLTLCLFGSYAVSISYSSGLSTRTLHFARLPPAGILASEVLVAVQMCSLSRPTHEDAELVGPAILERAKKLVAVTQRSESNYQ